MPILFFLLVFFSFSVNIMPMEVHSMIPKEFGPRLKISRRQKHLNQTDISKRLNITRQAYSNYETGRCAPPVDVLAELTLLLEYDFFSIFLEAAASKLFHSNFQFYPESEDLSCQTQPPLELCSFVSDSTPVTPRKK
ncbi:XRE family transcriptional regulator [Clostridium sp. AF15-6B]|nr:XRE family transcriptional regulator [Clostridium sp. AF16-25]RGH05255.1 XRE family transcriptional regulator [Clostridium sp. AF15-6B]RGH05740.1 XRE family transcriptional regulator [Clostridium sp. AF15-49]RHO77038.1 XRE family transcriptional regulator [Clostridium sp. AF43-10]RHQ73568.1 XRE family transcriptional regulator [Clostridium sp. AF23-8]RHS89231.1 XRE family transcriptional regulator [Clostridium sp. AM42-36]RHU87751.1 XRE family transcriptional regulator [Clostridium sp. OM0